MTLYSCFLIVELFFVKVGFLIAHPPCRSVLHLVWGRTVFDTSQPSTPDFRSS